ncbi:MAG: DUF1501 domain-containing protein [Planctomycetaceae bacterium]
MLSFYDGNYGRREFLSIGSLALGGLTLPSLLDARIPAFGKGRASQSGSLAERIAPPSHPAATGKSVIFLFMHGGPSQTETFDPKMTAPSGIRAVTGEVQTKIPGVAFGATFRKLAPLADRMTIVRSFATGDGRHDIKPIVCQDTLDANLGSIYSRVVGQNHPANGLPTNCLLFPRAVDPTTMPGITNFGKFDSTGQLGAAYSPFRPGAGGEMQADMKLKVPLTRLDDRRALLAGLDRMQRTFDASYAEGLDNLKQQAFSTILGGAAEAFDLSKEDPKLVARYDTAPLVKPENIDKKWNNHKRYADNGKTLGKLLLLARRLCERGAGFVTVTTNFVWDMHADKNNATCEEGMRYIGVPFDHAVSAFLDDVERRGLSDDILLVCCGEMGRTPKVNNRGGRDHWGNLAPLMLAGGGLKMGQVIGQSTRNAGEPNTTPVRIPNLLGTVLGTLFDPGQLRITRGVPRDVANRLAGYAPIPGLA